MSSSLASVSCIYGIGSPEAYYGMMLMLEKASPLRAKRCLRKLVEIQYDRAEDLRRGTSVYAGHDRNLSPLRRLRVAVELWAARSKRYS